jgi:hypothetical protein
MQIDDAVKFLSRATRLRLQRDSLDHHGAQTRKIGRRSSRQLPGFNGAIESLFKEPLKRHMHVPDMLFDLARHVEAGHCSLHPEAPAAGILWVGDFLNRISQQ